MSIQNLHILAGIFSLDILYLEGKSPLLMSNIQVNFAVILRILGYGCEFPPKMAALVLKTPMIPHTPTMICCCIAEMQLLPLFFNVSYFLVVLVHMPISLCPRNINIALLCQLHSCVKYSSHLHRDLSSGLGFLKVVSEI